MIYIHSSVRNGKYNQGIQTEMHISFIYICISERHKSNMMNISFIYIRISERHKSNKHRNDNDLLLPEVLLDTPLDPPPRHMEGLGGGLGKIKHMKQNIDYII
jgi:hypothetical protein